MTTRSAEASLRGYLYQFDKTASELLNLSQGQSLTVEGVEDIDISSSGLTTAIQCKYLEAQNFSPSRIRKPLIAMLDHFVSKASSNFKYHLYAYFSDQDNGSHKMSLDELKSCLTYTEKKKEICYYQKYSITDQKLKAFLRNLKIEFGPKIEEQKGVLIDQLKNEFSCNNDEAEIVYYAQALNLIFNIATQRTKTERQLTRRQFLLNIDKSEVVFSALYSKYKGKVAYIKTLKKLILESDGLARYKTKALYIDIDSWGTPKVIANLLSEINSKHYREGHAFWDSQPWLTIIRADENSLKEIKQHLINKGIWINDGFETIDFSPDRFSEAPLKLRTSNGQGQKIEKSSYHMRVVSAETFENYWDELPSPDVVFSFFDDELYLSLKEVTTDYFDLSAIDSVRDIKSILIGDK